MTELDPTLATLGDRLESAARADLAAASRRRPRRITRRLGLVLAVLAIGIPGVAIAADRLTSSDEVAQSMPAGTLALAGTEPTCTVIAKDIEYHCTLAKAPAPEVSDWKGTVEPTQDASNTVNGGCRSLASDGREWECYLGQAAVDQKIIGQQFLGETVGGPGQG